MAGALHRLDESSLGSGPLSSSSTSRYTSTGGPSNGIDHHNNHHHHHHEDGGIGGSGIPGELAPLHAPHNRHHHRSRGGQSTANINPGDSSGDEIDDFNLNVAASHLMAAPRIMSNLRTGPNLLGHRINGRGKGTQD